MHFVTGRACDLIVGVAAFQASGLRGLVQMAGEANLVGRRRVKLPRIADVVGRGPFGMHLSGAVTSFARAGLPSFFGVRLQPIMRAFDEAVVDVLVTDLASVRPG